MEKLTRAAEKSAGMVEAGPDSSAVAVEGLRRAFAFSGACYMIRERCGKSLAASEWQMQETTDECRRIEKDLAAIGGQVELLDARCRRIRKLRLAAADNLESAENEEKCALRALNLRQGAELRAV